MPNRAVLRMKLGYDAFHALRTRNVYELSDQFAAQSLMLIPVRDHNSQLSLFRQGTAGEAAHADDGWVLRCGAWDFSNNCHFAVVVNEAFTHQTFMSNPCVQLGHMEITQVYGL